MAKDPYKYYRIEARELLDGLTQGTLALEKSGADAALAQKLLRLAHTLKGAARVVKLGETAERAHRYEELLGPYRETGTVPRVTADELLKVLEGPRKELDTLGAEALSAGPSPGSLRSPPSPASGRGDSPNSPPPRAGEGLGERAASEASRGSAEPLPVLGTDRFQSVRVNIAEMDAVLEGVSQMGVQLAALRRPSAEVEHARGLMTGLLDALTPRAGARDRAAATNRARALAEQLLPVLEASGRSLASVLDRSEAELRQVRDRANALRLLPASTVFGTLELAVRDVAQSLDKTISFNASGGDHRLDGHVLAPLSEALLHCVRNACDHGIEAPAERLAAGKPAAGRVELSVERRGERVVFRCRDDGRGLNVEAVRRAAVARGRMTAQESAKLDLDGAIKILLGGGISTTTQVTEISGRGLGLDVVRETAQRLKGDLNISSAPGRGTTIELAVPASLTSQSGLVVEAGGIPASVPLDAVRRTLRVPLGEVAQSPSGKSIVYEGEAIPFVPLAELFGVHMADDSVRPAWTTVVIESRAGRAGIGVDRLVGQVDIIARPLPGVVGTVPMVMGCAFDADGDPQPVLDAEGLVAAVRNHVGAATAGARRSRPRILVIDDSLTTRMLEQSILESAGYEVALASSAEEGLATARERKFSLFLVDIEMPGMNGFEFIAATQADVALRDTPAILVSSLASADSRRRGAEAGARAYIVKGEFDQGKFLDTVRGLAG